MRLPAKPPPFDGNHLTKLNALISDPALTAIITRANGEYYHWDELRRRPLPLGLKPEEAWMALKSSRWNRRPTPLLDPQQRPFTYWLPDQAQQILHIVDRQGGGALAAEPGSPEIFQEMRDRVLIDSLMEEAIAT